MAIPTLNSLFYPVLQLLQDNEPRTVSDVVASIAEQLNLTPDELDDRYSNSQKKVCNSNLPLSIVFKTCRYGKLCGNTIAK
jgi:restriction endonuclease Mrr